MRYKITLEGVGVVYTTDSYAQALRHVRLFQQDDRQNLTKNLTIWDNLYNMPRWGYKVRIQS